MRTYKGTLNHVGLIGHLKKVSTIHESQNKRVVATIHLATDTRRKNAEGQYDDAVDWHNVVIFGNNAEFVRDHAHAGMRLFVEGKLQTREEVYEDRSGQTIKRYVTEIVASNLGPMDAIKPKTDQASNEPTEKVSSQAQ